VSKDDVMISVL